MLASRFQEAIDEAAMRLGEIDADAYTSGWNRDPWVELDGTPDVIATQVVEKLEVEFSEEKITALLDSLGAK
jgi:hypothetical protein